MTFGQQSGPPASARQVQELLTLLRQAGHTDFRDVRGPMGFTQRQAAGKFTRAEAEAFIDRLQDAEPDGSAPVAVPTARRSAAEQVLRREAVALPCSRDVGGVWRSPATLARSVCWPRSSAVMASTPARTAAARLS